MARPTQQAEILQVRDLSPHVRELVVRPLERAIPFQPGQWVSLHLPVGRRPPLVRAYSMAEPQRESGELVLAFDRVPGGQGSEYLWSLDKDGRVPVSGPLGSFVLPDPLAKDVVFIARYTGIVPIRCMIRHLFRSRSGIDRPVALLYSAPNREELIYHDEFQALAEAHALFTYLPLPGDASRAGSEAEATIERLRRVVGSRKDFLPMICGIKAFVQPLRAFFTEGGYERRDVKVEKYD